MPSSDNTCRQTSGGHLGFSISEIIEGLYLATEIDGIFGVAVYVFFRYIFLFFLYGNILLKTNATVFVMDIVCAFLGKRRGGAAMAAVTGSGALGSISGMAMGNVMITGVVTIPMMQKTGFKPWVAAGSGSPPHQAAVRSCRPLWEPYRSS